MVYPPHIGASPSFDFPQVLQRSAIRESLQASGPSEFESNLSVTLIFCCSTSILLGAPALGS